VLRERRIVFLPKSDRDGNSILNLRPLSLLKSIYKRKTQISTERIAGTMERILFADQYVFCRKHKIQKSYKMIITVYWLIHKKRYCGYSNYVKVLLNRLTIIAITKKRYNEDFQKSAIFLSKT
jgi:hypothetical protein